MASLPDLPGEVLKLVMQFVPLKHRLRSCCLVSKGLYAAAAAATESMELVRTTPQAEASAVSWIYSQGQHLTRLMLRDFQQPLLSLPCPKLQELCVLGQGIVHLEGVNGLPGFMHGCPNLTFVELRNDLETHGTSVDSLSRLVHLQHLVVRLNNPIGLSNATLARWEHLTHLNVDRLSLDNLLQLGALSRLRQLDLCAGYDVAVGPSSVPGLLLPASLETLLLSSPVEASILSLVPTGLQELQVLYAVRCPADDPGCFLSHMARLQQLKLLKLSPRRGMDWPAAGPAFSALTSSSSLKRLDIVDADCPEGIWQYVFSPQRKLPHLTHLGFLQDGLPVPSWGVLDLPGLINSCPNLCQAGSFALQPELNVSELQQLTALTSLAVSFESNGPGGLEPHVLGLAAVTQLKQLALMQVSQEFQYASLMPLTSLTNLTKFAFDWRSFDPEPVFEDVDLEFDTEEGSPPDVWLQLLKCCTEDPDTQATALCHLAQQLAEQRAVTGHQQQQIAGLQEELSAQQQASAKQLAGLQEQVAGLEGQLQQLHAAVQQLLKSGQH